MLMIASNGKYKNIVFVYTVTTIKIQLQLGRSRENYPLLDNIYSTGKEKSFYRSAKKTLNINISKLLFQSMLYNSATV
jgi:hypothetical protein